MKTQEVKKNVMFLYCCRPMGLAKKKIISVMGSNRILIQREGLKSDYKAVRNLDVLWKGK